VVHPPWASGGKVLTLRLMQSREYVEATILLLDRKGVELMSLRTVPPEVQNLDSIATANNRTVALRGILDSTTNGGDAC
jgi:hypothetical protein